MRLTVDGHDQSDVDLLNALLVEELDRETQASGPKIEVFLRSHRSGQRNRLTRRVAASALCVAGIAALVLGLATWTGVNGSTQIVTSSHGGENASHGAAPPARVETPEGWQLLASQVGPLPTGTAARITDNDMRFVKGSVKSEIEVDLQTGDIDSRGAGLDQVKVRSPGARYADFVRSGASRIIHVPGPRLDVYQWTEDGVSIQVIDHGNIGEAPNFIRSLILKK